MLKLGMKPIPGVSRVTVKKSKNVCSTPHLVYKFYICYLVASVAA